MIVFNFINQILFLCPYLVLYLMRVNSGRNCLLCCFRHDDDEVDQTDVEIALNGTNVHYIVKQASTATQKSDLNNEFNGVRIKERAKRRTATSETLSFKTSTHLIKFFLFNKKIRFIILLFFLAYFIFNSIICTRVKVDLPVLQLIPEQSFLHKHMDWHQKHFSLGPMVMLIFKNSLNYMENGTQTRIRDFLDDIKSLDSMTHDMELNWIQLVEFKMKEFCPMYFYSEKCFIDSTKDAILKMDPYIDDINLYEYPSNNDTNSFLKNSILDYNMNSTYSINESRIYVQFSNFYGTQNELDTWNKIRYIAYEKYNFTKDSLIVFTFVQQVFEQMDEVRYEFLFVIILAVDIIIILKFIYLCQLKFIYIHLIVVTSLFISIISILDLFQVQFNFISLLNFLIAPAIIVEYLSSINYIYLHQKFSNKIIRSNGKSYTLSNEDSTETSSSSSSSLPNNSQNDATSKISVKFELIKSLFVMNLNTNSILIVILLASFLVMYNCLTYNFKILFKIFLSILINLFLHINFLYPTLLIYFDNCKSNNTNNNKKHRPVLRNITKVLQQ